MNPNNFNRFNNMTPNMLNRIRMSNFNRSYIPQPQMIQQTDFTNNGALGHNNIKKKVLDEHIVEYKIHIDSMDRDIGAYKDPFHYVVQFNPSSTRVVKEYAKDGSYVEKTYKGPAKPHILRKFNNKKYIKIDNVCLPRYKIIKKKSGEDVYETFDTTTDDSNIYDDRFIELKIEELKDSNTLATNSHAQDSFGLIFPDKLVSKDFYLGAPFFMSRTYNNSQLGNISRLTIDFYDSYGEPLKITAVDENGLNPNSDPYVDVITTSPDADTTVSVDQTDLRHPLNKKTQNYISLRIGVIECQQNLDTKFEN